MAANAFRQLVVNNPDAVRALLAVIPSVGEDLFEAAEFLELDIVRELQTARDGGQATTGPPAQDANTSGPGVTFG